MPKSVIFKWLCVSFLLGILIDSIVSVHYLAMMGMLVFSISLFSVFWGRIKPVALGFCFLAVLTGIFLNQNAQEEILESELQAYNIQEKEIQIEGTLVSEPDVRESSIMLELKPDGIPGKILVITSPFPEYEYGNRIKASGRLQSPPVFDDFNYKDYLAKDGIFSVMYYPEIELVSRGEGNFILSGILAAKEKIRESIYRNLSPPHSTILGALLLGDKSRMSPELKESLNAAGVRHITAVSGMHVAIITSILAVLFSGLGVSRKKSSVFSVGLVALFVVLTGLQASAVRAGIMGSFFLAAQYFGREKSSLNFLLFAAVFMLAANPLLLAKDVGFQLSFLAVLGISFFFQFFKSLFLRIFKKFPDIIGAKDVLAMTFSAQVFTFPILIYNFGTFSAVSPVTNLLIVPVLPLVMALGFAAAIIGAVFNFAGWLLFLPLWVLLDYILKVVDVFSSACLELRSLHWAWLLLFYSLMGAALWKFKKNLRAF